MLRSLLLLVLLSAGCKSGASRPPAEGSGASLAATTGSGVASGSGAASDAGAVSDAGAGSERTAPASSDFARPLRGPFATLDAYCASRPKTDDHACDAADTTATGALPAGLLQAAAVYESNDGLNHEVGCAVALRTSAGWFVGPPSAETCREPSYIELEAIDVDTEGEIAAITFGISWHTKNGDDEAKYKVTALCAAGHDGAPACSPTFLSQCDARAPVSGCTDKSFALTWTIDGGSATFKPTRKIDNETVPTGKQALLGPR